MIPRVTLRRALADPNLLGSALPGDSWKLWRILLIASMGEELIEDEREIFTQLTGREREPSQRVDQFVAVVGRRGGKSRAMSVLVAYVAGLCDHTDVLVRGETGVALCVALDQRVAGIVRDHCAAVFEDSPILRQLIANRTQDTLELTNGINIEVRAASFRKLRGPDLCLRCHRRTRDLVPRQQLRESRCRNSCRRSPWLVDHEGPADLGQLALRQARRSLGSLPAALRP
jgi:hypothetical protein